MFDLLQSFEWKEELKTLGGLAGFEAAASLASRLALSLAPRIIVVIGGYYGGALFISLLYMMMKEMYSEAEEVNDE